MKRVDIKELKGNEILAKDVCTQNGIIILPAGSTIQLDYVSRLLDLGVTTVYIKDIEQEKIKEFLINKTMEQKIQEQCQKTVQVMLEKYSYCGDVELKEITRVAENIMEDILTEPEVIYNVSMVRNKSESTYSHSINVSALSTFIALKMKLPERRAKEIAIGALLHDIGVVFIPFDYNNIKYEDLTETQKKEIRKHVITGYSVVEKETWLSPASKEIILSHHERIDGSGYPMRLTANRVRLGTKIVAVCDEFDSCIYGNLAKKQKVHHVIDYIVSQAGVKYDFHVVDAFVASVAAYPNGTNVLTSEGEIGVVIRQNSKIPTRPVLKIISDKKGNKVEEHIEKNLAENLTLFISDTID